MTMTDVGVGGATRTRHRLHYSPPTCIRDDPTKSTCRRLRWIIHDRGLSVICRCSDSNKICLPTQIRSFRTHDDVSSTQKVDLTTLTLLVQGHNQTAEKLREIKVWVSTRGRLRGAPRAPQMPGWMLGAGGDRLLLLWGSGVSPLENFRKLRC